MNEYIFRIAEDEKNGENDCTVANNMNFRMWNYGNIYFKQI